MVPLDDGFSGRTAERIPLALTKHTIDKITLDEMSVDEMSW